MTEPEQSDEAERQSFVARRLGDLYAEAAKVVATLDQVVSTDAGRVSGGNRRLLYVVIALLIALLILLIALIILLAAHVAYSAGLLGG